MHRRPSTLPRATIKRFTIIGAQTIEADLLAQLRQVRQVLAALKFNRAIARKPRSSSAKIEDVTPRKLSAAHRAAIKRGIRRARRKRNAEALRAAQSDE